jgi:DNA polymerase III epsilon subunit-like protein
MYLLFDFETSGLYNKKLSAHHIEQAWPVQFGAVYLDKKLNIVQSKAAIIRPPHNNANIADKALETHGITLDRCRKEGIDQEEVANFFAPVLLSSVEYLIGHNVWFDIQFLQRYIRTLSGLATLEKLSKNAICTMRIGTKVCKLPPTNSMKKFKGLRNKYKSPTLEELYKHLFNKTFSGAHDAMADVMATLDCLRELVRRGVIKL